MNRNRRKDIAKAISFLEMAFQIVDSAKDEEQDCLDNIPENLENSDNYERIENAVDKLEDAMSSIEEALDALAEAAE